MVTYNQPVTLNDLAYTCTCADNIESCNGPLTLGRMPFRMFSEYEYWCSGSERTAFGKHSVYSRSILAVRFRTDVYGTAFGSS
jgi:hypothetical protein